MRGATSLDENISDSQRQLLRSWRIRVHQIGHEVGRQCWGAVECDEHVAKNIPDYGLEDNIVFSTDYPHLDMKYPHAVESFLKLPFSDQTKRKFLWDNCARLYGFGY
ncbi:MAG: amidohydrolase family protein [Candidatus Binatia bacterium]